MPATEGEREPFTPWLRAGAAIGLLLLIVVARSLREKIGDADLWWHLKTGALIAATHRVPVADPFSYSAAGSPWTAHEWLSELILYGLFRAGGFAAILWFRTLMLAAVVALVFWLLRRRSESFPVAVLLTVVFSLASSLFWSERPHLFTYLGMAALLVVLDAAARGRPRLLWAIPPAMVLWANLHGGFFAAFVLMGAFLAGAWLEGRGAGRPSTEFLRTLLLVMLLSLAAAACTPAGPRLLLYPLRYLTERGLATYIVEWQVPNVRTPLGKIFELVLLGLIALGIGTRLHWRWRDLLSFLVFAHLGLSAVRHVPIFILIGTGLLAESWPAMRRSLAAAADRSDRIRGALAAFKTGPGVGEETIGTKALGAALVVVGAALCALAAPRSGSFRENVDPASIPYAAGRWLQENVPPGRIFNYYDYGGYLIYLPRHGESLTSRPGPWQVVIDGREDVYGGAFMREYFDQVVSGGPRWAQFVDGPNRADIVFWQQRLPLTRILESRPAEWERVYPPAGSSDREVVIFRRREAGRAAG